MQDGPNQFLHWTDIKVNISIYFCYINWLNRYCLLFKLFHFCILCFWMRFVRFWRMGQAVFIWCCPGCCQGHAKLAKRSFKMKQFPIKYSRYKNVASWKEKLSKDTKIIRCRWNFDNGKKLSFKTLYFQVVGSF